MSPSPISSIFYGLLVALVPAVLHAQGPAATVAPPRAPAPAAAATPTPGVTTTGTLTPAEAEVQKCVDRIASVQRDVLNKYDDSLAELQVLMQKPFPPSGELRHRRFAVNCRGSFATANAEKAPRTLATNTAEAPRRLPQAWHKRSKGYDKMQRQRDRPQYRALRQSTKPRAKPPPTLHQRSTSDTGHHYEPGS